ncbi:hypothetical protein BBD42_13215 [Paenibacillus sp. BIHB 4019]|uniref:Uncharacterized protein n=1 Tax=Paenibacillus sp. BIHB 4019 TaxID=1870819 RepID=A0A1B2DHY5_9BACL|nr:hypothetical protein [Paenibacillus sp. BIHB 4019]ANY67328.1 hypothetical protein BBD42_13215 [Paenibacillus sp. BIHB 4019]
MVTNQQSLRRVNDYGVVGEQPDQIADDLHELVQQKQRALKAKAFFKKLADDPMFAPEPGRTAGRSLTEWLLMAQYPMKQEMVFDYEQQRYVPSEARPRIDLAELLTLLLRKKGINGTFEDMMDHVLEGGSFQQFLSENRLSKRASM